MAFVISDRVKESTTDTGTGTITLNGARPGFTSFAAIGNANTTAYCIYGVDLYGIPTGEWETGIGTYTSAGTTLSRGVIKSSNANALVSFSAGTKYVISCDVAGYSIPLIMADTTNRPIQVADQTALSSTAGNARGKGAVDLQTARTIATQVASGNYSVIGGGYRNTASKNKTVVAGGGNNVASAYYTTVCGGLNNTASGYSASILGGQQNTASAKYSGVLSGYFSKADKYGQHAHAAGRFSALGDAQRSAFVLRNSTTTNTQTELYLNGTTATQRLTLANDTTWAFEMLVVARRSDADNESAAWQFTGCIDRNTNAASTALVGTVSQTVLALDTSTWSVSVDNDTTNGSLRIRVTGDNSKTIKWVAYVRTTECTG